MPCNCQSSAPQPAGGKVALAITTRALAGLSIAGGLLSSSCCIVQLLLNALRLGCAGFAVLTPWQTQFRTLTVVSLAHLVYRDGLNRRSLLTVGLTVALMFSQDAVRLHNLYSGRPPPPLQPLSPSPARETRRASSGADEPTLTKPQQQNGGAQTAVLQRAGLPRPASPRQYPGNGPTSPSASLDVQTPDQGQGRDQGPVDTAQHSLSPGRPMPPTRAEDARRHAATTVTASSAGGAGCTTSSPSHNAGSGTGSGTGWGGAVYLRFHVEGIKCEGCAARLKAALLKQLPGLRRCAVDFASGQVLLWGAPGAELSAAEAHAVIQFVDLSYRATLVESRGL